MQVDLSILDAQKMLVQHKRIYGIENISTEPIRHVLHGIATDVPKYSISDLNLQIYDEKGRELKISSINVDKPDCKEFTTGFREPICKGDTDRSYTLVYEVEEPERYFENAFLIDCQKFTLNFKYPLNQGILTPTLYEINQETDQKTPSQIKPAIEKTDTHEVARWQIPNLTKGKTLRIEW